MRLNWFGVILLVIDVVYVIDGFNALGRERRPLDLLDVIVRVALAVLLACGIIAVGMHDHP